MRVLGLSSLYRVEFAKVSSHLEFAGSLTILEQLLFLKRSVLLVFIGDRNYFGLFCMVEAYMDPVLFMRRSFDGGSKG